MFVVNFQECGLDGVSEVVVSLDFIKNVVDDSGEDASLGSGDFAVGSGAHGECFAAAGLAIC